jgi:hypothetical protein
MTLNLNFSAIALAIVLLGACGNSSNTGDIADTTTVVQNEVSQAVATPNADSTTILGQLQGKWQSTDDKTNFLEFKGNLRREIADGMDAWDEEPFVLSDKCKNPQDAANELTPETNRYMSCTQSDLCWYVETIDAENLSLVYMGRGNTLKYIRVKE